MSLTSGGIFAGGSQTRVSSPSTSEMVKSRFWGGSGTPVCERRDVMIGVCSLIPSLIPFYCLQTIKAGGGLGTTLWGLGFQLQSNDWSALQTHRPCPTRLPRFFQSCSKAEKPGNEAKVTLHGLASYIAKSLRWVTYMCDRMA